MIGDSVEEKMEETKKEPFPFNLRFVSSKSFIRKRAKLSYRRSEGLFHG
jgi:hypothetical protein